MKLELLTNATVVDDAIRFVTERTRVISSSQDAEESREPEPGYNHDNDGLKEELEKDTAQTRQVNVTTNQVF